MKRLATVSVGILALLVSACSDSGTEKTAGSAEKAPAPATQDAAAPAPATAAIPPKPASADTAELDKVRELRDKAKAEFATLRGPWKTKSQSLEAAKAANDTTLIASLEEELKVLRRPYLDAKNVLAALEKQVAELETKIADAK